MVAFSSSAARTGRLNIGVQILRGVAATMVLVHHAIEETRAAPAFASPDWATRLGAAGVDIFFVISGLVITLSAFRGESRATTPGRFFAMRAHRIYPFYWLCLLSVVALSASGIAFTSQRLDASRLIASALLAPHPDPIVFVAWTLVFEMYFYMTMTVTLALGLSRRACAAALTGTICLALAGAAAVGGRSTAVAFLGDPIALEFCFGVGLAVIGPRLAKAPPALLIAFGLAAMALASAYAAPKGTGGLAASARFWAWGLPAAAVVLGFSRLPIGQGAGSRLARLIGDASYAIYLTHIFAMIAYAKAIKIGVWTAPGWGAVALVSAGALAIGVAAHLLVEKPLGRLTRPLFLPAPARGYSALR